MKETDDVGHLYIYKLTNGKWEYLNRTSIRGTSYNFGDTSAGYSRQAKVVMHYPYIAYTYYYEDDQYLRIRKYDEGGDNNWGIVRNVTVGNTDCCNPILNNDTLSYISTGGGTGGSGNIYFLKNNQGGTDNWGQIYNLPLVQSSNNHDYTLYDDYLIVADISGNGNWESEVSVWKKDQPTDISYNFQGKYTENGYIQWNEGNAYADIGVNLYGDKLAVVILFNGDQPKYIIFDTNDWSSTVSNISAPVIDGFSTNWHDSVSSNFTGYQPAHPYK